MNTKLLATAFAVAMTLGAASAANAKVIPLVVTLPATVATCGAGDLDLSPGGTFGDCRGFYEGQYLSGNPTDLAIQNLALSQLGFGATLDSAAFTGSPKFSGLGGQKLIDFAGELFGETFIGVHYGAGQGSPAAGTNTTAFYRFDAGTAGLDTFELTYGASSDVILYRTGAGNEVPEPATWALLIMGFGGVGAMLRTRRLALA